MWVLVVILASIQQLKLYVGAMLKNASVFQKSLSEIHYHTLPHCSLTEIVLPYKIPSCIGVCGLWLVWVHNWWGLHRHLQWFLPLFLTHDILYCSTVKDNTWATLNYFSCLCVCVLVSVFECLFWQNHWNQRCIQHNERQREHIFSFWMAE